MKIEAISSASTQYHAANQEQGQKSAHEVKHTEKAADKKTNFPGEKQLIEGIEQANKDLKIRNTSLRFSIHEQTKEIMVKIIDNETQEIIREIPPEKILDMIATMLEKTGLFVDKKA